MSDLSMAHRVWLVDGVFKGTESGGVRDLNHCGVMYFDVYRNDKNELDAKFEGFKGHFPEMPDLNAAKAALLSWL